MEIDELRKYLYQTDQKLANRANVMWDYISKQFHGRQTEKKVSEGGREHCEIVENNIWRLINGSRNLEKFNKYELFILSNSACCHDFDKAFLMPPSKKPSHGVDSGKYIFENLKELSLEKPEALAIDIIVRIHDLQGDKYTKSLTKILMSYPLARTTIKLRLLAALLKAADVLHCDTSRIAERIVDPKNLTELERMKYLGRNAVVGWSIDGARIILTVCPESKEEKEAMEKCISYLEENEWKPVAGFLESQGFPHQLDVDIDESKLKSKRTPEIDCVILCGGYAERLWPLTKNDPKVLLPIGGEPCVLHVFKHVKKIEKVKNIYLLVNEKHQNHIKQFVDDYKLSRAEVIVEPPIGEKENWGPLKAIDFLFKKIGNKDYLIIGGDNLFNINLGNFVDFAVEKNTTCNVIHRSEYKFDTSEYGAVKLGKEGLIEDLQEKKEAESKDVSTAIYYINRKQVEYVSQYFSSSNVSDSLGSLLRWLITQKVEVPWYQTKTPWFDIGTRSILLEANAHYIQDRNEGQIDSSSNLKGPAQIKSGTVIKKSTIGPNVFVGENCTIEGSYIENSIIMKNCNILYGHIKDSIIGNESDIEGSITGAIAGPQTKLLLSQD